MRAAWALLCVAACASSRTEKVDPVPAEVRVLDASIVVKTGMVGVPRAQLGAQKETYALADVENGTSEDRIVSVEGTLVGKDGAERGKLAIDELVVPAHARRTFALVGSSPDADATGAKLHVRRAPVLDHPLLARIVDVKPEPTPEGLVADLRVENTADSTIVATVIASFHDAAGAIVARQFQILEVAAKSSRPYRFTGPKTAATVDVYVGEVSF